MTPPTRRIRRCQEMRGWLIRRWTARSLTFSSPTLPSRSRMRRRVGLARARKWSGSSRFWLGRNIKVALYVSLTHKGSFMCGRPNCWRRGLLAADQVEEFRARARVLAEGAEHARGDHLAARLLHTPHLHAEVTGLDDDANPPGRERPVERLRDLLRHLLLKLQAVGEDADQARDLAQANDLALRQVAHVAGAEEGQHVVLAQAVERDVLDHDHLVVVLVEDGACDDVLGAHAVPVGQLAQRARDARGRGPQALALRVLAQLRQHRLDQRRDLIARFELRPGHVRNAHTIDAWMRSPPRRLFPRSAISCARTPRSASAPRLFPPRRGRSRSSAQTWTRCSARTDSPRSRA